MHESGASQQPQIEILRSTPYVLHKERIECAFLGFGKRVTSGGSHQPCKEGWGTLMPSTSSGFIDHGENTNKENDSELDVG